jgi:hypothetical protein
MSTQRSRSSASSPLRPVRVKNRPDRPARPACLSRPGHALRPGRRKRTTGTLERSAAVGCGGALVRSVGAPGRWVWASGLIANRYSRSRSSPPSSDKARQGPAATAADHRHRRRTWPAVQPPVRLRIQPACATPQHSGRTSAASRRLRTRLRVSMLLCLRPRFSRSSRPPAAFHSADGSTTESSTCLRRQIARSVCTSIEA